jgi:hypothetical protein
MISTNDGFVLSVVARSNRQMKSLTYKMGAGARGLVML